MNYKSMFLIGLLLPAFCYSQDSEEPVSTVEAKTSKQVLKIVLLEKKDNVTLRKTIKLTYLQKYLFGFLVFVIGEHLTDYALTFFGFEPECWFVQLDHHIKLFKFFCLFTIADNVLLDYEALS